MQVSIRKFEKNDISNKVKWINDPLNNTYLHYDIPLDVEKTERWFDANKDRTDRYDATILCDGVPVGLIGLLSIAEKKAEFYITMGEPEYKGKGIAKQASFLLFEYARNQLGLHSLYLYTEVDNVSAQKLFERVGFRNIGKRINDVYNKGCLVSRYEYIVELEDLNTFSKAPENSGGYTNL